MTGDTILLYMLCYVIIALLIMGATWAYDPDDLGMGLFVGALWLMFLPVLIGALPVLVWKQWKDGKSKGESDG
jgi:hypothetical protein